MVTTLIESEREHRLAIANRIKELDDVVFPALKYWNYGPCAHHATPKVECQYRSCGGELFSHQRVGTTWLYAIKYGLLADEPGVGKTSQLLALIAMLKERGELTRRAVVIPNTPAVKQWGQEAARWIPGVKIITVDGSIPRDKRIEKYVSGWDVLIVGSHIAVKDRDLLERLAPFDLAINDDVDPLLDHDNMTHQAIAAISYGATRSFTVNATVLQTRLQQLHAALVPAGGYDVFRDIKNFERTYVRTELVNDYSGGKKRTYRTVTGVKNTTDLQNKVRDIHLRRKATELTDIRMPMLMPPITEWLDLSPLQRAKYDELQEGVLRMIREEGEDVKYVNALTKFLYGQQICAGLPALNEPDGPGASPKLDWLFDRLTTVWEDRKTIVFVKNVGMVRAALVRAQNFGMSAAMIWGQKQSADQREEQKTKFWEDPNCRFLIGTTALERSHNLQCANTLVNIDTHLNPARMTQLLGRGRRAGSPHDRVFMFTLLTRDTQEERYMQVLSERQAMSDTIFEDESELYEKLPPLQLLQIMRP